MRCLLADEVHLTTSLRSQVRSPTMFKNPIQDFIGAGVTTVTSQIIFRVLRILHDASSVQHDLKWIFPHLFWFYRQDFYSGILRIRSYIWIIVWLFVVNIIFFLICRRWRIYLSFSQSPAGKGKTRQDPISTLKLKPLIFPCRTSHTRMFPQKHSFSYSYLLVGIPIGFQGSSGSLLIPGREEFLNESKETKYTPKKARLWFRVEAADYLSRGNHTLGLEGKLHAYLRSQVSCEKV